MGRRLDHRDHRRELDANRYVYAVVSRRAGGVSIGVNLNTDKVCNFACPYCQVDRTTPGGATAIDVPALGVELEALLARARSRDFWQAPPFDSVAPALRRLADVAFAGDGEPTSPPEFSEAARQARACLGATGLDVPLRLITNATLFQKPRVREALGLFDELWCKLDAGTEAYFRLVDGTRLAFPRVLGNLLAVARERPIVIQSLFLTWQGAGPSDAEIGAYVGRLDAILRQGGRIDHVQVYSVARAPADPRVGPLDVARLDEISARVRALGLSATTYA